MPKPGDRAIAGVVNFEDPDNSATHTRARERRQVHPLAASAGHRTSELLRIDVGSERPNLAIGKQEHTGLL